MILWEEQSLDDRLKIYEFLFDFSPEVAEKTDQIIEDKVNILIAYPYLGVQRHGSRARLLIMPEISITAVYCFDGETISILRVVHHKQKFPDL